MFKQNHHSESQEWYFASYFIITLAFICYMIIFLLVLPEQSEIFPMISDAITLSFVLLGLSGVFLAIQGYRFRKGKAFLIREEGDKIIVHLEKFILSQNISVKEIPCVNAFNFGLWRPIGRLSLSQGEIEIKEIWISAFFYRTQVAFRGTISEEIVDEFKSNLV